MTSKKLINKAEDVVEEAMQGFLQQHPSLRRLEGLHVILRDDYELIKERQVALISGGGSGHEPAHAGFIGPGMLTAVVCGGVFASPSISSILAAIRAVTGPHGSLLIVKNYTGDRLNFGMAREQAMAEGLKVEMVVAADDCALPKAKGITGRRGVAGTVYVHKIAGAAAAAGLSLAEIKAEAQAATDVMGSLGVALSVCTVPGTTRSDRLDGAVCELGLGIHGEPGIERLPMEPCDALVDRMIKAITGSEAEGGHDYLPIAEQEDIVVLVNNLGATPPIEMSIVARRVVQVLEGQMKARIHQLFVGPFMTSLEMAGVSITIMKVDYLRLARLDAPTTAPGWQAAESRPPASLAAAVPVPSSSFSSSSAVDSKPSSSSPLLPEDVKAQYHLVTTTVSEAIIKAADHLNELDRVGGDGDCGVTLERGAKQVLALLDSSSNGEASKDGKGCKNGASGFLIEVAEAISLSMGGTSGALLEIFFRAMARALREMVGSRSTSTTTAPAAAAAAAVPSSQQWGQAFQEGVEAVMYYGGARPGYRTMLDALVPAAEALVGKEGGRGGITEAVKAARSGVEATKKMGALAGRANYVNDEILEGQPDPGAEAVAIAMEALAQALSK